MITIILDCGPFFNRRARYVWDTFFRYYKAEYRYIELADPAQAPGRIDSGATVYCGPEAEAARLPGARMVFCHEKATGLAYERLELPGAPVWVEGAPFLFGGLESPPLARQENRLVCRADFPATAFFFLSAYQEYAQGNKAEDHHGRYPLSESYQARYGLLEIPVVNLLFELVAGWLEEAGQPLRKARLPGGTKFALALSHDVDRLEYYHAGSVWRKLRCALAEMLKHGRPAEAFSYLEGLFRNPHDTFSRIVRLHRKCGAQSSFYFVFTEKRHPQDPDYSGRLPEVERIVRYLLDSGCEVGLHGSYVSIFEQTYPRELELARSLAGTALAGGRIHYLRLRVQPMFELFEKAGPAYDSSLGFAEAPGYRTGFGLPHLIFDHREGRPFSTLEIPLNVMDTTLFDSRYLGLGLEEAFARLDSLVETAKAWGLVLVILTHNDFYLTANRKAVVRYREFLARARNEGGLLTDLGTIFRWWKSLEEPA